MERGGGRDGGTESINYGVGACGKEWVHIIGNPGVVAVVNLVPKRCHADGDMTFCISKIFICEALSTACTLVITAILYIALAGCKHYKVAGDSHCDIYGHRNPRRQVGKISSECQQRFQH